MLRQAVVDSALLQQVPVADLRTLIIDFANLNFTQHQVLDAFEDIKDDQDLTFFAEATDKEFIFEHKIMQKVIDKALSFPFGKCPALLDVLIGVIGDLTDPRLVRLVPQMMRLACFLPRSFGLCETLRQTVGKFALHDAVKKSASFFLLLQNPAARDLGCVATILLSLTKDFSAEHIFNNDLVSCVLPHKGPEIIQLRTALVGKVLESEVWPRTSLAANTLVKIVRFMDSDTGRVGKFVRGLEPKVKKEIIETVMHCLCDGSAVASYMGILRDAIAGCHEVCAVIPLLKSKHILGPAMSQEMYDLLHRLIDTTPAQILVEKNVARTLATTISTIACGERDVNLFLALFDKVFKLAPRAFAASLLRISNSCSMLAPSTRFLAMHAASFDALSFADKHNLTHVRNLFGLLYNGGDQQFLCKFLQKVLSSLDCDFAMTIDVRGEIGSLPAASPEMAQLQFKLKNHCLECQFMA